MTRILVVEDEAHIAEALQFNLEAEGYETEVVGDGPSASERLREGDGFDLVVLDLMLPGM
ncbi:MAG: response regulator, partial [Myxococcales bacterium]|nr:response regulator [Myxococcales bacterium]